MSSETKVSQLGQNIAQGLDEALENLCGERMGFVLMVFPFDREGQCNYMANIDRADGVREIKTLLERWETGQPDIPLHKKN